MVDTRDITQAISYHDLFSTYISDNYGFMKMTNDGLPQVVALAIYAWRLVTRLGWCLRMLNMFQLFG